MTVVSPSDRGPGTDSVRHGITVHDRVRGGCEWVTRDPVRSGVEEESDPEQSDRGGADRNHCSGRRLGLAAPPPDGFTRPGVVLVARGGTHREGSAHIPHQEHRIGLPRRAAPRPLRRRCCEPEHVMDHKPRISAVSRRSRVTRRRSGRKRPGSPARGTCSIRILLPPPRR